LSKQLSSRKQALARSFTSCFSVPLAFATTLCSEAAAFLICFAKGLCVARRKDVETGSRVHWNLEKFWWLKPAIRAKTLRIHLVGSVARLLVHPHQFFFDGGAA